MRTLCIPEYARSRAWCNMFFLRVICSFFPKTPYVMHHFRLSRMTTRSPRLALNHCGDHRTSITVGHLPPVCPQGRQRRLRSHRGPLKPPPQSPYRRASLAVFLPCSKKETKTTKQQRKTPFLTISLFSRAVGSPMGLSLA